MALTISYFAWVRERMGIGEESIERPVGVATVADLIAWLAARDERGGLTFSEPGRVRAAVDGRMAGPGTALGRDIALFPPVTGG